MSGLARVDAGFPVPQLAPNIRITKTEDVEEPYAVLESVVRACQGFLSACFGPPRFTGRVTIQFTSNPRDNGRMVWKKSSTRDRTVYLNHLNLYRDAESTLWDIIVHEMFHALYQSPELIAALPIFAVEAQASFAQYMAKQYFVDGTWHADRIYGDVLQKVEHVRCDGEDRIDLDAPFAMYGSCITNNLYLLGALLFAYEGNGIHALEKTLDPSTTAAGVEKWIKHNHLAVPPSLLTYLTKQPLPSDMRPPAPVPMDDPRDLVRNKEVQIILKKLGHYTGPVDGILGPVSRKAITGFQEKHGLDATGLLDKPTLSLLETAAEALGIFLTSETKP